MDEGQAQRPWWGGSEVTDQEGREQLRKRIFSISGQGHPSGALGGGGEIILERREEVELVDAPRTLDTETGPLP